MNIDLALGEQQFSVDVRVPDDQITVAQAKYTPATPLWLNTLVAEADFKVVVGRIAPHNTHGYEGGAKMITPATSYWLTVLRNHSCNFSPFCEYGSYGQNPSRADVDDIGEMVNLNYI